MPRLLRFRYLHTLAARLRAVPLATRLPLTLGRRNIYILPTASGVLFAFVLCLMLVGAINYNLSLGHALVFMLAALALIGSVHTFRNLLGLQLSPLHTAAVFAGENACFALLLENPHAHSRHALIFRLGNCRQILPHINGHSQQRLELTLPALRRGVFRPGILTLTSYFPLGLFRAWSRLHPPLQCLVYPQPLDTPLPAVFSAAQYGRNDSRNDGEDDFSGLRPWRENDSPRHIAWKSLARQPMQAPLVKQFSACHGGRIMLTWAATMTTADVETRLSQLAGWIVRAEHEQLQYGLQLPGHEIAPDRGRTHRDRCLAILARHEA